MKRHLIFFIIHIHLILIYSGCSNINKLASGMFKKEYNKLQVGMAKKDLIKLMGMPFERQSYMDPSKRKMEVWFFKEKVARKIGSRKLIKSNIIRIILREGRVIGWNQLPYSQKNVGD